MPDRGVPIFSGRTRFGDIVAEFWMPKKPSGKAFIIMDGCPGVPSKHQLGEFLARKGYWVFHPRYRGSWESGGEFLRYPPEEDVRLVARSLNGGFSNVYGGMNYFLDIAKINVVGASFGGTAAILSAQYKEINKVIAFAPVIDWKHYDRNSREESFALFKKEIREGFGGAYRFTDKNFDKLKSGKFYDPLHHVEVLDGNKIFLAHAKDDTVVPFEPTVKFARTLGRKPLLLPKGGHLSSRLLATDKRIWKIVNEFLKK